MSVPQRIPQDDLRNFYSFVDETIEEMKNYCEGTAKDWGKPSNNPLFISSMLTILADDALKQFSKTLEIEYRRTEYRPFVNSAANLARRALNSHEFQQKLREALKGGPLKGNEKSEPAASNDSSSSGTTSPTSSDQS